MSADALRMLELFTSVGAQRFDVTFTDVLGQKVPRDGYFGSRTIPSMRFNLPRWTKRAGQLEPVRVDEQKTVMAGLNLIMRPHDAGPVKFVQLDDLQDVSRVKDAAFMVIQTSPGNHQAWLAVNAADSDFIRRLRKGSGADPTASGATRVAGTHNFKAKYAPYFPVIAITDAQPGRIVSPAQLEQMGLVAPVEIERKQPTYVIGTHRGRVWPSYQRCLQGAPQKHSGEGPDVSIADYHFCLMAATWGFTAAEIKEKLTEISTKAQSDGQKYVEITADKASAYIEQGRARSKG